MGVSTALLPFFYPSHKAPLTGASAGAFLRGSGVQVPLLPHRDPDFTVPHDRVAVADTGVAPRSSVENVSVPCASPQHIVTRTPSQTIRPPASDQPVIAPKTEDCITASRTRQPVVPTRTDDQVEACRNWRYYWRHRAVVPRVPVVVRLTVVTVPVACRCWADPHAESQYCGGASHRKARQSLVHLVCPLLSGRNQAVCQSLLTVARNVSRGTVDLSSPRLSHIGPARQPTRYQQPRIYPRYTP